MKKKYYIITSLIVLLSCGGIDEEGFARNGSNEIELSPDDDGKPHPSGSYNYSHIAVHPRILMTKNEEVILKNNLIKNNDLAKINEIILQSSNEMLNTVPVSRVVSGVRLLGVSRTALKRIFYLSYSYRMTGDSKYLTRAEREILAVCDFSDWNPSHFLDVGEMALAVAIGYDWLFDGLQESTRDKVRKALKSKAFEPSKDSRYNWFLKNKANWNQVCNAGLTIAALAIYEGAKEDSVEIIERCLESVKLPLQAYGLNGNYTEGYMYWSYGTNFQTLLLASLESALGSDKDLHKIAGFMKTAEYMLFMEGVNELCFNYADSYNNTTPKPSMFWFAKKSNNPSLLFIEKKLFARGSYLRPFEDDRILPMTMVFANMESFDHISPPTKKLWTGNGATPVVLVRTAWNTDDDRYVGIKAGKASESHGHMDAGSFVYDAMGVRWAADLGMQAYAPLEAKGIDLWSMGQNSERWSVFRLNNRSHNTLTVNNKNHLVDGMATITEVYDTDSRHGAVVDLTPVFKDDLRIAKRSIFLMDDDLHVEDIVEAKNDNTTIRWSMLTPATYTIEDDNTIKMTKDGQTMFLHVDSTVPFTLKSWTTAPNTDFDEANPNTIMVGFEAITSVGQTCRFNVRLSTKNNK